MKTTRTPSYLAVCLSFALTQMAAGQTFSNTETITIPASNSASPASPYPSTIMVSGLAGPIESLTVSLHSLSHGFPQDIQIVLISPSGAIVMLMGGSGAGHDVSNADITFMDGAPALPDDATIVSGTYRPTQPNGFNNFPAPVPPQPYGRELSVFNDTDGNGMWALYVIDITPHADDGQIAGGWSLNITTQAPVTYQGRLNLSGSPVNDTADLEFRLWDADTGGNMVGSVIAVNDVMVVDGLFTVQLLVPNSALDGSPRWWEINVRSPSGSGNFTTLSPRQRISFAPQALHALTAKIATTVRGAVFTSGDNVGIGTTTPTDALLDVEGDIRINDNDIFLRGGSDRNHGVGWYGSGKEFAGIAHDGPVLFGFGGGSLGSTNGSEQRVLTWNNTGNVGIGTTTPATTLDVMGTVTATAFVGDGAGLTNLPVMEGLWSENGPDIFFDTGNVGIGTTTPATALDVVGTVTATAFVGDGAGLTNLPVMEGSWSENGPDIFFDTGNVGIGTTTPAEALDVNGNVIVRGVTETDQVQEFINANLVTETTPWQSFTVGVDGSLVQVDVFVFSSSTAETGTLTVYEGQGPGGTIISSGPFTLPTGVTQWVSLPVVDQPVLQSGLEYTFRLLADAGTMHIATGTGNPYPGGVSNSVMDDLAFRTHMRQSGVVGIGTTTPATALDVMGTVTATAFVGDGAGLTNLPVMEGSWSENGPDIFFDTGNVGIGTTTPTDALLDVEGDIRINDNDIFLRGGSDPNHGLGWYGSGKEFAGSAHDGPVLFGFSGGSLGSTNGSEQRVLTWDDIGNVGIGTTSPESQLHIKQNSDVASSAGLRLERPANTNHWDIYTFNDDDLIFEFNDQGSGAWAFIRDQDLAFAITSDRRAKKDIRPLTDGLDKVLALRPVTFRYKHNDAATSAAIGMIAQEVEAILPELVDEKEGMKTLSYQSFGVLAIKAIQEQQAQIANLNTENQDIRARLERMEAILAEVNLKPEGWNNEE